VRVNLRNPGGISKSAGGWIPCFAFRNSYPDWTPDFEIRVTFTMKFRSGSYQSEPCPESAVVASHFCVGFPSTESGPALLQRNEIPRRSASLTHALQGYFGVEGLNIHAPL
jgi:hypothetical protein